MSKRVIANLVFFFVGTIALVVYGGATLLNNPLAERTKVSTTFPEVAGLRSNFSASYNGVIVGRVSGVELVNQGVRVTVELDPGVEVPNNVEASIFRANAVGEQRVDFSVIGGGEEIAGETAGEREAPPLENGATVPAADGAVPPNFDRVLNVVRELLDAVPTADLNTVVSEGSTALAGRSEDFQNIIRDLTTFSEEFLRTEPEYRQLLESGPAVLRELIAASDDIEAALANTVELTDIIADRRFDVVDLFNSLSDVAVTLNEFTLDVRANLDCLLGDAATLIDFTDDPDTVGNVQGQRLDTLDYVINRNTQFLGGSFADFVLEGPAADIEERLLGSARNFGSVARPNQTWIRVRFLVPPPPPPASRYSPARPTPPVRPGGACESVYPGAVGPVTQENPAVIEPVEQGDGRLVPAGAEGSGSSPGPVWSPMTVVTIVGGGALLVGLVVVVGPNRRLRRPRPPS